MFTADDIATLSNENGNNFLVKEETMNDLAEGMLEDAKKIIKQRSLFKAAAMSKGDNIWANDFFRNDQTCWITPDVCRNLKLESFVKYIQSLMKEIKLIRNAGFFDLNSDYSVQFAIYPAKSRGYIRHKDSHNNTQSLNITANHKGCISQRKLTIIYYLNKEYRGGQLRIYLKPSQDQPSLDRHEDIEPKFGRMVIFRSDIVEHEVLPNDEERIALTFWSSSDVKVADLLKVDDLLPPPSAMPSSRLSPLPMSPSTRPDATIFVGIAAYRDSELQHTVHNLFHAAARPERVFVGIVWQGDAIEDAHCFDRQPHDSRIGPGYDWDLDGRSHIRLLRLPLADAAGVCFARHLVQQQYRGEDYWLQVDSHMRFRGNWDEYLVQELERLRDSGVSRPVLTTYPLGYHLPDSVPADTRPTLLKPQRFDEDGMLRQAAEPLQPPASADPPALRSPLWAAGFSFSDGCAVLEVPYDPELRELFFGEEVLMAARLYTSGFDFFAPPEAVVYHLWSRSARPPELHDPHKEEKQLAKRRAQAIVRQLLEMEAGGLGGCRGLGTARSLQQFAAAAGVDFPGRRVLQPDGGRGGSGTGYATNSRSPLAATALGLVRAYL